MAKVTLKNVSKRTFHHKGVAFTPNMELEFVEQDAQRLVSLYPGEIEAVEAKKAEKPVETPKEETLTDTDVAQSATDIDVATKTEENAPIDPSELKVPELKAILDSKGIEYNKYAKKPELVELVKNAE